MFKAELTPILYTLSQKTEQETILPNSFYEASIILMPKPDKDYSTITTTNHRPIYCLGTEESILNKILANKIQ